jgi:hypothetical protein
MVDSQRRAMDLFKAGRAEEARRLQTQFLAEILASGEDLCSCPGACEYHGRCLECVMIHRGHGDHLPHCFQRMTSGQVDAPRSPTE